MRIPGTPGEPSNESRADCAYYALSQYNDVKEGRILSELDDNVSEVIDDLMCDLMHLLNREGIAHDWTNCLRWAEARFSEEISGAK